MTFKILNYIEPSLFKEFKTNFEKRYNKKDYVDRQMVDVHPRYILNTLFRTHLTFFNLSKPFIFDLFIFCLDKAIFHKNTCVKCHDRDLFRMLILFYENFLFKNFIICDKK